MPLQGIEQPEFLHIEETLRLRKYDGSNAQALAWYRDPVVYYNSEGITEEKNIPDRNYIDGMYKYLDNCGELYWIEVKEGEDFRAIGDVTLKKENPPIAIGEEKYRGCGIGKKVMKAILSRAKSLGWTKITGSTVYTYNISSQKLHESLGFVKSEEKDGDFIYELDLMTFEA